MINNLFNLLANSGEFTWGPIIAWVVILIVLILFEALTAQMVCLWFIIGTVPALILAACKVPVFVQILVFIGVSVIALLVTRPFLKKFSGKAFEKTNVDAMIGATGVVTKAIGTDQMGEVSVQYQIWNAISKDNSAIPVDKKIIVLEVKGNKLIVEIKED